MRRVADSVPRSGLPRPQILNTKSALFSEPKRNRREPVPLGSVPRQSATSWSLLLTRIKSGSTATLGNDQPIFLRVLRETPGPRMPRCTAERDVQWVGICRCLTSMFRFQLQNAQSRVFFSGQQKHVARPCAYSLEYSSH